MKKKPNFLIIGAMKCATSTLHEQLALQPNIFMTTLKEPNFFSDDERYHKGIQWYLSHFEQAGENDLCGESSTHYSKLPTYGQTVSRLKTHLPHTKFIYVMRHPIDRLISQYIHEWTQRVIDININEAIYKYPELMNYSKYTMQIEPYIHSFGQHQLLPVFFERLLKYPQQELERICDFIGYSSQPQWQIIDAVNVSQERMRQSAWRDILVEAPILRQIRQNFIPKTFRNKVKNLWTMKTKPQLNSENILYLKSIFNQDLKLLGSWLNIELNCDNYKSKILNEKEIFWQSNHHQDSQ